MSGGRRVVAFFLVLLLIGLMPKGASAQYGQYGQYGGPGQKEIQIEKTVAEPQAVTKGGNNADLNFVENLTPSDPRFSPGQEVTFRLVIRNTSDEELSDVTVRDFVPDFLEPVSNPGDFDKDSRTITFSAGNLAVDQEKEFFLKMKVVGKDQLPEDQGVMCVVNKAEAEAEDVSNEDSSQFCIEKQVTQPENIPAAGPEMGLGLIAINALGASLGLWLRKRN